MGARIRQWADYLRAPVDAASLAVVRIVLGATIAWDAERYFSFGWIDEYYIRPKWSFPYLYLEWVRPWPGDWMYVHFAALFAFAVLMTVGLFYRFAVVLVFLAYTYIFLLEKSVYMNHYYLIALLCFLLIWMQPHRAFALDRFRRPELPATAPRWNVLLLRVQLFIVYFYGALAKLNPDWLAGEPMYSEIVRQAEEVPALAAQFPPALLAYSIAYGGIVFDAGLPLLLCFRRTRLLGFILGAVFHLLNHLFLNIGLFSYLMTGAITIFFDPDWPRQLWRRLTGAARTASGRVHGSEGPRVQAFIYQTGPLDPRTLPSPGDAGARPATPPVSKRQLAGLALIHLYVLAQLLVPLRHWLYPGEVSWTEEGHRFSWHMKLRRKAGEMAITVRDPATGRQWQIDPADDLGYRQLKKLHTFPDIVLQYVHYKRDELRAQGVRDPVITVDWRCSLNGAPPRPMIDPTVNLASEEDSIWPARWIVRDRG